MIIETSDNRFYRVWETVNLAHLWDGFEVKRGAKGAWIKKYPKLTIPKLVRKEASRVVEA